MSWLILRFHDAALDGFDWIVTDQAEPGESAWQQSNLIQLSTLVAQHAMPIVIAIPQQLVYLTEFELPERASRQVLSSIEYQIEDQLAQDTELQHYATGKHSGNKVPIVVVEQSIMRACRALQEKYGLRVVQIIPELFLCPWQGKTAEVNLMESHEGYLLRYGAYQGIKCQKHLLNSVLNLINQNQLIESVNYYLADESTFDLIKSDQYAANLHAESTLMIDLNDASVVDLQQRQFQSSSNWLKLFQAWKSVTALIILLFGVGVYSRVLALQDMEEQLTTVKANQYELVKDYLNPKISATDNLKKEVIKILQQKGDDQKQSGFLDLLLEFSQARTAYQSIVVVKIGYQQQRLSVDFSSKKLDEVEALHAALNANGLTTGLERLNIKPDFISGQFVIEGGGNG